jgi:hypothetical protein
LEPVIGMPGIGDRHAPESVIGFSGIRSSGETLLEGIDGSS